MKLTGKLASSPSLTSLVVPPIDSFGEYSMLQPSASAKSSNTYGDKEKGNALGDVAEGVYQDDESDFFKVILSEIEKVNKFFVG